MNLLDVIIIVLMAFFIIKGIFRGFVREIFSLGGIILGIWLGIRWLPRTTNFLTPFLEHLSQLIIQIIGFSIVFIITIIFFNLFGWIIKSVLQKAQMGWFDRMLGAGFALIKGIILMYLGFILLTFFLPMKTPLIAHSRLAPVIIATYQSMARMISPETYQEWKRRVLEKKPGSRDRIAPGKEEEATANG